jgi:hypothetical protein
MNRLFFNENLHYGSHCLKHIAFLILTPDGFNEITVHAAAQQMPLQFCLWRQLNGVSPHSEH